MFEDFSYRLRIINAVGINCPIILNIDKHDMIVIATDSNFVKPASVKKVILYPGE